MLARYKRDCLVLVWRDETNLAQEAYLYEIVTSGLYFHVIVQYIRHSSSLYRLYNFWRDQGHFIYFRAQKRAVATNKLFFWAVSFTVWHVTVYQTVRLDVFTFSDFVFVFCKSWSILINIHIWTLLQFMIHNIIQTRTGVFVLYPLVI